MTGASASTTPAFFQTGGTLPYSAPSYVERQADRELLQRALASDFCYVLTPRQMGKSSLMVRTARSLQERGVRTAIVDLTSIGTHVTESQWYLGLLKQISNQLKLRLDLNNWWQTHAHSGAVARFREFFAEIILVQSQARIVIFIDEIDSTLSLPFSDDFFAAVRALYNERAINSEWQRLTFVFLGVVTPADLIKNPARTPFNIGQEISLPEFQWAEAAPLRAEVCRIFPQDGERIFKRIFYWTNGQPYLTQQLCATIAAQPTESWDQAAIDSLVRRLFLSDAAQGETNIRSVSDKILNHPRKAALLRLYGQVYSGKLIPDEKQSLLQSQLKLSGLVKVEAGRLQVRNELYRQAFNQRWIHQNTDLNWYAVSSGVLAVILGMFLVVFAYDTMWVAGEAESARLAFYESAAAPERRAGAIVRLLRLQPILFGSSSQREAMELFFSLNSWDEQKAIYDPSHFTNPEDLALMVQQVYGRLVNVDDATAANSSRMLARMQMSLQAFPDHEAAAVLAAEIDHWLQGRQAFLTGDDSLAVSQFELAVQQSGGQNPATLFELARAQIRQGETAAALTNLDRVLAIAANEAYQVEPTSTPTLAATATVDNEATPTGNPAATAMGLTPMAASGPIVEMTVIASVVVTATLPAPPITPSPEAAPLYPTPTPTPGPVRARFDSQSDMIEAARSLIEGQGSLIAFLSQADAAAYPNLQRVIAIPTVTLTLTPPDAVMFTPTPTRTPPSTMLASALTSVSTSDAAVATTTTNTPLIRTPSPAFSPTFEPQLTTTATSGIGGFRVSEVDGMRQLFVPAGFFLMGSTDADANARSDEKPQHEVYLDAFWIDETEVTNGQYVLFLNDVGSHLGQCDGQNCIDTLDEDSDSHILRQGEEYVVEDEYADHPVINVSWYGANAYCEWAGRALPTEAQWEKAARGADGRIYPWGNTFDGTRLNYCDSNCEFDLRDTSVDDGYARTAPVGRYPAGASPYGALEMAGNVWEWVVDWYDSAYYQNSPLRNPPGPADGSDNALRGGAWYNIVQYARAAYRNFGAPADRYSNVGFRCAQE